MLSKFKKLHHKKSDDLQVHSIWTKYEFSGHFWICGHLTHCTSLANFRWMTPDTKCSPFFICCYAAILHSFSYFLGALKNVFDLFWILIIDHLNLISLKMCQLGHLVVKNCWIGLPLGRTILDSSALVILVIM